jgi:hypothetical protein
LVDLLAKDLGVSVPTQSLEVYCPSSRESLSKRRWSLPKGETRGILAHLKNDWSFYAPAGGWLYLSRPTINHASTVAGFFVHAHLSARHRSCWDMPKDFLALVWIEAVGFFLSKWINPKRKADTLDSLRRKLEAQRPKDKGKKALALALEHRLREVLWCQTGKLRGHTVQGLRLEDYLQAAHILGAMLGERLFQQVRSKRISRPKLLRWLRQPHDESFATFYWETVRDLESG